MTDITTRKDIEKLVDAFYAKIREDEVLGDIFNSHIAPEQWPAHLVKLSDFWETNLFGIPKFKGNPSLKHIQVDRNLNYGVTEHHFTHWLSLWFETIDQLFEGERAEKAKYAAQKMASGQYITIWHHRPGNS